MTSLACFVGLCAGRGVCNVVGGWVSPFCLEEWEKCVMLSSGASGNCSSDCGWFRVIR